MCQNLIHPNSHCPLNTASAKQHWISVSDVTTPLTLKLGDTHCAGVQRPKRGSTMSLMTKNVGTALITKANSSAMHTKGKQDPFEKK